MAKVIANISNDDFLATFGRKLPDRLGDRINAVFDLIGFKKIYVGRVGTGPDAVRHYQLVPKYAGIDYQHIFESWLDRDRTSSQSLAQINQDSSPTQ